MSKLEASKSIITVEWVQQVARFYQLTIDELMNDYSKTLSLKALARREN